MNMESTGAGAASTERDDFAKVEARLDEIKSTNISEMTDDDLENVMAERKALRSQQAEMMSSAQEEATTEGQVREVYDDAHQENQEIIEAEKKVAEAEKATAEAVAQAEQAEQSATRRQAELAQADALLAEIKGVNVEKKENTNEAVAINAMVEAARAYRDGGSVDRTQYDTTWKNIPDAIKEAPGFSDKVSGAMREDKEKQALVQEKQKEEAQEIKGGKVEAAGSTGVVAEALESKPIDAVEVNNRILDIRSEEKRAEAINNLSAEEISALARLIAKSDDISDVVDRLSGSFQNNPKIASQPEIVNRLKEGLLSSKNIHLYTVDRVVGLPGTEDMFNDLEVQKNVQNSVGRFVSSQSSADWPHVTSALDRVVEGAKISNQGLRNIAEQIKGNNNAFTRFVRHFGVERIYPEVL